MPQRFSQTIRLNFRKLKSVFSHQKLKVVKGLPQKDLWVWLSPNGMDPNKVHRRLTKILKELYTQQHYLLGLQETRDDTK